MNAAELRQKTKQELNKELLDLLREQFNLRMQKGAGQFSRYDQFSKVRKDIARIKTVLNERAIAGDVS
jgi:large subunit ribosomal protein L29